MNAVRKILIKCVDRFRSKRPKALRTLSSLLPPHRINYNYVGPRREYAERFFDIPVRQWMPAVIDNIEEFNRSSEPVLFFDVGCGFGPMASAFKMWLDSDESHSTDGSNYLGVDIRSDSINWLKKAYAHDSRFRFVLHLADKSEDYVHAEFASSKTRATSAAGSPSAGAYNLPDRYRHNIQWSSSLFTHLTPETANDILQSIARSASQGGLQFNTWLLIDAHSRYSISGGLTDRELPFDMGPYLTYSRENPLVCTAYKRQFVDDLYQANGFEILRVERGSWRGTGCHNSFSHYQDVVISRKI